MRTVSANARAIEAAESLRFTIEDAQTTLPAPTSSADGAAIPSTWDKQSPKTFKLFISAAAIEEITAGQLWGYDATDDVWYQLADLNNGATIYLVTGAKQGWSRPFAYVAGFTRLALSGTLLNGAAVTVQAEPILEK